jgi:Family of unknown function (DUF6325)
MMRGPPGGVTITAEIRTTEVSMEAHEEELGPVDIAVIGYPKDAPMTGEAVPILMQLAEDGIIRVLDAIFVIKEEDGRFAGVEATGLDEKGLAGFREFEGASSGLLGDDDVAAAADALNPGEAAAVIMYENRWAAPFIAAVRRNGGEPIAFQRIPVPELMEAIEALDAIESTTT